MVDRLADLGPGRIDDMLADHRRQEVVSVISQSEWSLYQQAAKASSFSLEVVARPGQIHTFDIVGEDADFEPDRLIREGELAVEILSPDGLERDFTLFWRSLNHLKEQVKQNNIA